MLKRLIKASELGGLMDCLDHGRKGNRLGYSLVNFNGKTMGCHVKALIESSGEQPDGRHCMHICDNPRCIEPTHLKWGTSQDNMRDKWQKGRAGLPKYVDVAKAKEMRNDGLTLKEIGKVFGVSKQAIHLALKA